MDIEESWADGRYEKELLKLDNQLAKEIWAHDVKQSQFKRENLIWKSVITCISIMFGIAISVGKEFFPDSADFVSELALVAIIPALVNFYSWRDPAGRRAVHVLVAGQKGDIRTEISDELLTHSELANTFYTWINRDYSRVGGTNGAHLSAKLLSRYRPGQ